MLVLGITGGVGTGKSTVAAMLREQGAEVLDADAVVHELMRPGQPAWRELVDVFGRDILQPDKTVDRKALAGRVFQDAEERRKLEAMLHPRVLEQMARRVDALKREGRTRVVVLDVPLLLEAGAQRLVDKIVVVSAPRDVQQARLRHKGWSEEDIAQRMNAQWDLSAKVALADAVIDNGGSVEDTRTQVTRLWNNLVEHSNP